MRFEIARLEIDKKTTWFGESLVIYFMNSKLEVFRIDKSKDGFSKKALEEIKLTAEEIGLRVSKY